MKRVASLFLVSCLAAFIAPVRVLADGMFVVPKFVWDKHKDINEPTQKAILVYDAGREDLILQVKYEGPVSEFGWLVPVPGRPAVQEGSMKCFYELSRFTQQHLESVAGPMPGGLGRGDSTQNSQPPVKVIEIKTVGAYEIAVLSARDSGALKKWLDTNHFYFPENKTGVLDSCVKQHWYFIAIKIDLGGSLLGWLTTPSKLASGELNPLQISFASDKCVYPLKISSLNGKPTEVQLYVLSPEPMIEKAMFHQKAATVPTFSGPVASWMRAQYQVRTLPFVLQLRGRYARLGAPVELPVDGIVASETRRSVPEEDLLPYTEVTGNELPECSRQISRLQGRHWWLTKQTWTFQPEQMNDLLFQPAISVFLDEITRHASQFAAENLAQFGTNAVPAFVAAFQSTNLASRICAFPFLQRSRDTLIQKELPALLTGTNSQLRFWAAATAGWYRDPKLLPLLLSLSQEDKDDGVRYEACLALGNYCTRDTVPFFLKMLESHDLDARASALFALRDMPFKTVNIPRQEVFPLFRARWAPAINLAFRTAWILGMLQSGTGISCQEAIPLLQNPTTHARLLGLEVLRENANKESIELAVPMLTDPKVRVRNAAEKLLRLLTRQDFPRGHLNEWQEWWRANKTNSVVRVNG